VKRLSIVLAAHAGCNYIHNYSELDTGAIPQVTGILVYDIL
jgi:hypothetical protein